MDLRHIGRLGALNPSAQQELTAGVLELEDLHNQVIFDLRSLADQGYAVAAYKDEADAVAQEISLLKADLITVADDGASLGAWRQREEAANKKLRDILKRTGGDRQTAPELAQLRGFGWALGVLAVATGLGIYVYTHRARARRRRR